MALVGWILLFFTTLNLIILILAATDECKAGTFGLACKLKCDNCIKPDECTSKGSKCTSGCKLGFYGSNCLFESKCRYDLSGQSYQGQVAESWSGKPCIPWSKVDSISQKIEFAEGDQPENYCRNPKWDGKHSTLMCYVSNKTSEECTISKCSCPDYLHGDGCSKQCHCFNDAADRRCGDNNGYCDKNGCAKGWNGTMCDKRCPQGRFGRNCRRTCSPNCLSGCEQENGWCINKCVEGFFGVRCTKECKPGTYGKNCKQQCGQCLPGDVCDTKTGACPKGCRAGYTSTNRSSRICDKECEGGNFGKDCKQKCGWCSNFEPCNRVNGKCPLVINGPKCKPGFQGNDCKEECPAYKYGSDCSKTCGQCRDNVTCDHITGHCQTGCQVGYVDYECIQRVVQQDDTTLHIGIAAAIVFFLIVIIIILIVICRRKNKKMMQPQRLILRVDHPQDSEQCRLINIGNVSGSEPPSSVQEEADNRANENQEPIYENIRGKQTNPVPVAKLYDFIQRNKENYCKGFKEEFQALPMGLIARYEIARLQENKMKNRYGNIVAYDHSRVVLDQLTNDPHSDYVNANYMDGYSRPKAYIASQGPNKMMIVDFWRMVWQQRVSKIVMLTNLMEACKKKCEQYWPDEGSNKYGDLNVLLVNTTKYTDFTIRTFELTKEMEHNRIVKQFHFTTWSDHGAPTYPTTLLAFRRKVMNFKPDDTAPILSHCSAGIGRTGTFIALNYLLEQAADKGEIDVLGCAQLMRSNRVNMIQTLEQYVFVYEAVLESIKTGNTTLTRKNFRTTYEQMLYCESESDEQKEEINGEKSPTIDEQYNVLQLLSPTVERDDCSAAIMEDNMAKNRFKNILPANRSRPYLYTPVDGCNDYINAVYLSGYTQKDQFIVTQMPLPTTVGDFWRMLYDTSSDTIIMLNEFDRNDKSCALYWPEEYGYSEEHGPLSVELLSSSETDVDVTLKLFKLSHLEKGEERAIKQFMFKSWADYQTTPNSVTPLLRLYRMVQEWLKQNSKGPVTIHCMNGASKAGVFVAMSLLLERLDLDYEVDVYQTVKQIRINRPQFIENLEQYKYLYQIVQEYMDQE